MSSSIRSAVCSKYLTALILSLSIPFIIRTVHSYTDSIFQFINIKSNSSHLDSSTQTMASETNNDLSARTPVYFLGIGGPNFIENTKHPAYAQLASIGLEITTKVKPKAVVVFSAHWQSSPNKIEINVAEQVDIIYDFYGFPAHYYEHEYPNRGSKEVAERVIEKLGTAGIEVDRVERGLDHGVWAGFMAGKR